MKNFIFLLCGLGAGSGLTYIIMKELSEKKISEETEKVQEYYEEEIEELKEKLDNYILNEDAQVPAEEEKKPEEPKKKNTKKTTKSKPKVDAEVEPDYDEIIDKLNYNKYSTKTKGTEPKQLASEPYIIDFDEFNDNRSYIKRTLSYFEEDDVLMDSDSEEVLDNVGRDVGYDNLAEIQHTEDMSEIYIRNEVLGEDYHVIKEDGSYEDFIADEEF